MLDFCLGVIVTASIYGMLSICLNLQAGDTGLLNFGLVAFFGIGAYATGIASMHGIGWPLGILIGMVLAAAAGAAVGFLGRSLAAVYWAMATLALAQLLQLTAINSESLTRGVQGISELPGFFDALSATGRDLAWAAVTVAALVLCVLAAWLLGRYQFGRVLRLIRENENLAASLSHNVVGAKMRVLAVSAPMAALAGSLYTLYIGFIGPSELEPFTTFLVFTMVVVGGLGNLTGIVVGAFLVQLMYSASRFLNDLIPMSANTQAGLRILIVGLALLGFLLFRPGGLIPRKLRSIRAA